MQVSGMDLLTTFGVYGGLGLVVVCVYGILHSRVGSVYSPRRTQLPHETPADLPQNFLGWIWPLVHGERDAEILQYVGLDAYLTIRFGYLCWRLFLVLGVLGALLLIPVYVTQGSTENLGDSVLNPSIEILTLVYMTGPDNHSLLLLPFVMVFLFTAIGIYLLHYEYCRFVALKREYYSEKYKSTYTVLIERIPDNLGSKTALFRYFESIYPGAVLQVDLIASNSAFKNLKNAVEDREDIVTRLEQVLLQSGSKKNMIAFTESQHWMGLRGFCYGLPCHYVCQQGRKVDSEEYLRCRLSELNEDVAVYQNELKGRLEDQDSEYLAQHREDTDEEDDVETWTFSMRNSKESVWLLDDASHAVGENPIITAAFVTFKNKTTSVAVSRCLVTSDPQFMVSPAPVPGDLNWNRLGAHPVHQLIKRVVIFLLLLLLLLTFGILTSVIAVSTNLENMRTGWEALNQFLLEHPEAIRLFNLISPLLLLISFALVPPVLNVILEQRGLIADSMTENSFFIHYYVFLVVQMFLFYQISGAVFTVITNTFVNPQEFLKLLASMLPSNAGFFMQYLIIRTFWVLPFELIRGPDLLVAFLIRPFFFGRAKTPRQVKSRPCGCRTIGVSGDAWHGLVNAINGMLLVIGVSYSIVSPLISLFAMVYFSVFLLVYRNQLLYVYVKKFESGASNWSYIAIAYLCSFMLLHLLMMGLFALYTSPVLSVLMIVPFGVTVCYAVFMAQLCEHGSYSVSLSDARRFDIKMFVQEMDIQAENYHHPLLAVDSKIQPEIGEFDLVTSIQGSLKNT